MLKNILAAVGLIAIVAAIGLYVTFGGMISKAQKLDAEALPAYMAMFEKVVENGDAARAMMKEWKINEEISNEDAAESIKALAEEYNMRITGDVKRLSMPESSPCAVCRSRRCS